MRIQDIDFLIIGAAKSATTWLQQSLQQNPAVYMPDPELHYFSRNTEKSLDWYLSQFHKEQQHLVVGEKSNSYLDTPGVAQRIRRVLPDVKLIAQLRNPVDRAYSDYCMLFRRGEVGRDIARHLDPRNASGQRFLNGGRYFEQLQAYLDLYPSERLLILFYEETRLHEQRQLDRVHEFLQLPPHPKLLPVNRKVKDKRIPVMPPGLRRALRPLKPVVAPFRDSVVFQQLRAVLAQEVKYSPLDPDLRARLIDHYAKDVEKLGALVGRDLTDWLSDVRSVRLTNSGPVGNPPVALAQP